MPSPRPARPPRVVEVQETEILSPGLIRIVFAGEGLHGFSAGEFTDEYVKLQFPPPGASYGPPFDPAEVRSTLPREQWSRTRSYTVRDWDPETNRLTVDFVVHGDDGVAGPWARATRPGDLLQLTGPGGAYRPDPTAGAHLLAGDESALPAIAVALEHMPEEAEVAAVLQVPSRAHEIALPAVPGLALTWLHGNHPETVLDAVRGLALTTPVQAFVHGEAEMVRAVRRHLLVERGVSQEMLSASGYWKRDRTDEGWRAEKPEWNRLAEADLVS